MDELLRQRQSAAGFRPDKHEFPWPFGSARPSFTRRPTSTRSISVTSSRGLPCQRFYPAEYRSARVAHSGRHHIPAGVCGRQSSLPPHVLRRLNQLPDQTALNWDILIHLSLESNPSTCPPPKSRIRSSSSERKNREDPGSPWRAADHAAGYRSDGLHAALSQSHASRPGHERGAFHPCIDRKPRHPLQLLQERPSEGVVK